MSNWAILWRVVSYSLLLLSISVLCFVTMRYCESAAVVHDKFFERTWKFSDLQTIPGAFSVPSTYLLPIYNQHDWGTCWAFAAIYILESQYRHQGIVDGYLDASQFVRFSEEAMILYMNHLCSLHPDSYACYSNPRKLNLRDGGFPQDIVLFSQLFPDFAHSILPWSACPYQKHTNSSAHCQNLHDLIKKNPLKFEVKSVTSRHGVERIKRLLFEKHRPITFIMPLPEQRFYLSCDNPYVNASYSDLCTSAIYKCPGDDTVCVPVHFGIHKTASSDMMFYSNGETYPGTGHAVVLVGYNDHFVLRKSAYVNEGDRPKGGFIFRNSWGARGHSLDFLMGALTDEEERRICPSKDSVFDWTPTSLAGLENGANFTRLTCVNASHCDVNTSYALLADSSRGDKAVVRTNGNGVPVGSVIRLNDRTVHQIESLPFHHLYFAFQVEAPVNNSKGVCGYMFIPYKTIDELAARRGPFATAIEAVDIEVEWDDSSYASSGWGKDYTHVLDSTFVLDPMEIDTPYQPRVV